MSPTTANAPVPAASADRITCDALVSPVKYSNGVPVSVGRSAHIVPDRTRRLVEHPDQGCRIPGCNSDRHVEVHHIIHWTNNGPTNTFNLICLCPKHHRLHHQRRLGITGNADLPDRDAGTVEFTDRDGKLLTESGARPQPPRAPPPPINGTYEHPIGERLDFRWLHFHNDPQQPQPLGRLHPSQTAEPESDDVDEPTTHRHTRNNDTKIHDTRRHNTGKDDGWIDASGNDDAGNRTATDAA